MTISYSMNPNLRRAVLNKQAQDRKSPYKMFCKEKLEQYNCGLITSDEYYKAIADAKLLK